MQRVKRVEVWRADNGATVLLVGSVIVVGGLVAAALYYRNNGFMQGNWFSLP